MTPWPALISLGHTALESMRVNPPSREELQRHDVSAISAHHRRQAMVVSLQIGRALSDAQTTRCARGLTTAAATLTAQWCGTAT